MRSVKSSQSTCTCAVDLCRGCNEVRQWYSMLKAISFCLSKPNTPGESWARPSSPRLTVVGLKLGADSGSWLSEDPEMELAQEKEPPGISLFFFKTHFGLLGVMAGTDQL